MSPTTFSTANSHRLHVHLARFQLKMCSAKGDWLFGAVVPPSQSAALVERIPRWQTSRKTLSARKLPVSVGGGPGARGGTPNSAEPRSSRAAASIAGWKRGRGAAVSAPASCADRRTLNLNGGSRRRHQQSARIRPLIDESDELPSSALHLGARMALKIDSRRPRNAENGRRIRRRLINIDCIDCRRPFSPLLSRETIDCVDCATPVGASGGILHFSFLKPDFNFLTLNQIYFKIIYVTFFLIESFMFTLSIKYHHLCVQKHLKLMKRHPNRHIPE
jgi:hypothetical protein